MQSQFYHQLQTIQIIWSVPLLKAGLNPILDPLAQGLLQLVLTVCEHADPMAGLGPVPVLHHPLGGLVFSLSNQDFPCCNLHPLLQ